MEGALTRLETCEKQLSELLEIFKVLAGAAGKEIPIMKEEMARLEEEVNEVEVQSGSLQALASKHKRRNNGKCIALLQETIGQAKEDLAAKRKENQRLTKRRLCLSRLLGALEDALLKSQNRIVNVEAIVKDLIKQYEEIKILLEDREKVIVEIE